VSRVEDRIFLLHILDAIHQIHEYINRLSHQEFMQDRKTQDAVVRQIEIIGEAAAHVSTATCTQYSQVPWRQIIGMRNRLIHGYFQVNLNLVWNVATREVLELQPQIEKIVDALSKE
jgi:uncharacterized protein with HEPN domain